MTLYLIRQNNLYVGFIPYMGLEWMRVADTDKYSDCIAYTKQEMQRVLKLIKGEYKVYQVEKVDHRTDIEIQQHESALFPMPLMAGVRLVNVRPR